MTRPDEPPLGGAAERAGRGGAGPRRRRAQREGVHRGRVVEVAAKGSWEAPLGLH